MELIVCRSEDENIYERHSILKLLTSVVYFFQVVVRLKHLMARLIIEEYITTMPPFF